MDAVSAVVLVLCVLANVDAESKPGAAPLLELNDGRKIPQLALGTWLGFESVAGLREGQELEVQAAVTAALAAGYRHIDTASIYETEKPVGAAVADAVRRGDVTREDLFITTKLWNDKHAEQDVVPALRQSLQRLGLDYVDLYLVHWPFGHYSNFTFDDTDFVETWRGMVEAQRLGLATSIGVSNFNQTQLERLMKSSEVKPAVLQIELNLNLQQPELRAFCAANKIVIMAYTPFGSLFGSKVGHEAPPPRVDDPTLVAIAQAHNKTVPQVALRYLLELGVVPIPKTVSAARARQNIDVFDFSLTQTELQSLKTFDVGFRSIDVSFWSSAKEYPFERKQEVAEEESFELD